MPSTTVQTGRGGGRREGAGGTSSVRGKELDAAMFSRMELLMAFLTEFGSSGGCGPPAGNIEEAIGGRGPGPAEGP